MSWTAARSRRPAMVVNSPGTARTTSWPARKTDISTIAGCHAYGRLISPAHGQARCFARLEAQLQVPANIKWQWVPMLYIKVFNMHLIPRRPKAQSPNIVPMRRSA